MTTHNSTWRTLLNTIFHDVLQECELWVNFGEKSGDSEWKGKDSAIGRNSGADELIAFHMNIGKQFFMIASSVIFFPFHVSYFCVQLAPNVELQHLAQDKYFSEELITL